MALVTLTIARRSAHRLLAQRSIRSQLESNCTFGASLLHRAVLSTIPTKLPTDESSPGTGSSDTPSSGSSAPDETQSSEEIQTRKYKLLDPTFPDEMSDPVKRVLTLANASTKERTIAQAKSVAHAFRLHEADTGSTRVQSESPFADLAMNQRPASFAVARLTVEINALKTHIEGHHKDRHSARSYSLKISKRKRLLAYLERIDPAEYVATLSALDLPLPKAKSKKLRAS